MKTLIVKGHEVLLDDDIYEVASKLSWYLLAGKYPIRRNRTPYGRETLFLHHLVLPQRVDLEVDHINRNPLDNRRENLRYVEHWKNGHNRSEQTNNTSGTKGISFNRVQQQWHAYIWIKGKRKHLGYFSRYEQALEARRDAERLYL